MMNSDITPALFGITSIFLTTLGDWFGVPFQSLALYLAVGLVATATKIGFTYRARTLSPEKRVERRWQIAATFGLSVLITGVFIPALQLRLDLKPLEAAAYACGLIFTGEIGIFLVLKKFFGFELIDQTEATKKNE